MILSDSLRPPQINHNINYGLACLIGISELYHGLVRDDQESGQERISNNSTADCVVMDVIKADFSDLLFKGQVQGLWCF